MDRVFRGKRTTDGGMHVTMNDKPLTIRTDLVRHADTQSQLALSILAAAATDETAKEHYQLFQKHILLRLPDEWEMTDAQIASFVMLYCVGSKLIHPF